jgi:hypothetical protein
MKTKLIEKWIQEARWSPSGGNNQPWDVLLQEQQDQVLLKLRIRPELKQHPTYADPWGAGSLLALGAFFETLNQTATFFDIQLNAPAYINMNSNQNSNYWDAEIHAVIKPATTRTDQPNLPNYFSSRTTNRWPMHTHALPPQFFQQWQDCEQTAQILLRDLTAKRSALIPIYRELAFIRMHNQFLFTELMQEIFNQQQHPERADGLPFETLGLPKFTTWLLGFIQHRKLHFKSRFANHQSVVDSIDTPLTQCGHIFYIEGQSNSPESWFLVGRQFQRIWLLVEKNQYALQPIAYNLIAFNHLHHPEQSFLDQTENRWLQKAMAEASHHLQLNYHKAGILFRIGQPKRQAQRSPRRTVPIHSESQNYQAAL